MPEVVSMMSMGDHSEINLGPCCICEGTTNVKVVVQLNAKCPTRGRGWGCMVCGLPSDGAMAVLCLTCAERELGPVGELVYVCTGYPGTDGRTPASQARGSHKHDLAAHMVDAGWEE